MYIEASRSITQITEKQPKLMPLYRFLHVYMYVLSYALAVNIYTNTLKVKEHVVNVTVQAL